MISAVNWMSDEAKREKLNKVCVFDLVQTTSSEFVFRNVIRGYH